MVLKRFLLLSLAFSAILLAILTNRTISTNRSAFAQGSDSLSDPLALGAWLYQGNCVRCHGSYENQRVGQAYSNEDELIDAIDGSSQAGCEVDWARTKGGSLSVKEIKAIALYIMTWEELGEEPDLPELPDQPTPTPTLAPESGASGSELETASASPTPEIDPAVKVAIQGSELAWGAWLYTQNCHRCHLDYSMGRMGYGLPAEKIKTTIENGKAGTSMPAFSKKNDGDLSYKEIKAVMTYIAAYEQLSEPPALPDIIFQPPTPDPNALLMVALPQATPASGDIQRGELLYAVHCVKCHGPNGVGGIGSVLAKHWLTVRPDLTIRAILQAGSPNTPMPAWAEANGGPLSEADISDLIALILSWEPVSYP